MSGDAIRKYLSTYAEQEVTHLVDFPANVQFEHCVVIPVYNETAEFFTRLQLGPLHNQRALYIAVINQPMNDADTQTNELLMQQICLSGEVLWHKDKMQLLRYSGSNNYWLVVDRFSISADADLRLPSKEGVGLARKIGGDIAATLIARSQVVSPWIHSTDADAFLPKDYFDLLDADGYSAVVYDFKHQNDGSPVGRATELYERSLRYYVNGLSWAGSPYAYHTVGSALAINARSYCEVRGFPRRSGGEDFYLLNKLAKVGSIYHATDRTVRIKARESDRVPFGTGPAVTEILKNNATDTDYACYNPKIFVALREWLTEIPSVWPAIQSGEDPLEPLSPPVREALQEADWDSFSRHLQKQIKTHAECEQALHQWFDAFQTLKFIHYLQAHYYPALALAECLAQAEFTDL